MKVRRTTLEDLGELLAAERRSGGEWSLSPEDRVLVEMAFAAGKPRPAVFARQLGLSRQAVHRRYRRMRDAADYLRFRRPAGVLPEPELDDEIAAIFAEAAEEGGGSKAVPVGEPPAPPTDLDPDGWPRLKRLARSISRAPGGMTPRDRQVVRALRPLREALAATLKPRPTPPSRIPQLRCHHCGRWLERSGTGRPRKWCNDTCRGRERRRQKTLDSEAE